MQISKLIIQGEITGIQERKYSDNTVHFVQFMTTELDQSGNTSLKTIEIKLCNEDRPIYKAGQIAMVEVSVRGGAQYSVNYTAITPIQIKENKQ